MQGGVMNPGEYEGQGGHLYRWVNAGQGDYNREWLCNGKWRREEDSAIARDDIAADRAALDALIESEKKPDEWVEWSGGNDHFQYRATKDEGRVEWNPGGKWEPANDDEPEAFRAGRKAALEQVQEWMWVTRSDFGCWSYPDCGGCTMNPTDCENAHLEQHIQDLAEAVKT